MSVVSSAEKISGWVRSTRPVPTLRAVVVEGDVAALGQPAAVVGELDPHLVLPAGQRLAGLGRELLHAEHVVDELRAAVLDVERPAAEPAALRDDHALRWRPCRRSRSPRSP